MSWIPAFEVGFWNAWLLTLFVVLHPLVMKLVDKAIGTGNLNEKMGDTPVKKGEKWCHLSISGFTQSLLRELPEMLRTRTKYYVQFNNPSEARRV